MVHIKNITIIFLILGTAILAQQTKTSNFSDWNRVIALADVSADGLSEFETKVFFNRLETELVNLGGYIVITRTNVEEILKEQKIQQSGCTDQACAVEMGKLLGAKYMLLSNILFDTKTKAISLTLKLIDVETGVITTSISKDETVSKVQDINDKLYDYLVEMYRKDAGKVSNKVEQQKQEIGFGSVKIETNPIGARVMFDNQQKGLTPLQIDDVEEGSHAIILSYDGYERLQKGVIIVADSTISISEVLIKLKGNLRIMTEPSGCGVYLNDVYKGTSPLDIPYLDVDNYFLKVSHDGFHDDLSKVTVQWNKTEIIKRTLTAKPASVAFFSVPDGATVLVDNKAVGVTTSAGLIAEIPHGFHEIQMKRKGFTPVGKSLNLAPDEKTSLELHLIKLPEGISEDPNAGWVNISGWPEDCKASLAGKSLELPVRYYELKKGEYLLNVWKDGYISEKISLSINAQKLTETQFQLKPVDRSKANIKAWTFPGLGHFYAEKTTKGIKWTALEIASLCGIFYFFNDFQSKLSAYNDAHSQYLNATTYDEIELRKKTYQNAFDRKNISLAGLGTMSGVAIGVWIWNVFDLNRSIPNVLPFPKDSSFNIGINEKGELETQVEF